MEVMLLKAVEGHRYIMCYCCPTDFPEMPEISVMYFKTIFS